MKLELFCKKLAIHHWVIGLMFALTWNTVIAAPPSQTASEIERALSGASG